MKRGLIVAAFLSLPLAAQQPTGPDKLDPTRLNALQNALRNMKLQTPKRAERLPSDRKCVVPLLEARVDPDIDRNMVHRVPRVESMPATAGLPPCPGDYRIR